jgi:hypothetical protein
MSSEWSVGDTCEAYLPTKPGWFRGRIMSWNGDKFGIMTVAYDWPVFKTETDLRPVSEPADER